MGKIQDYILPKMTFQNDCQVTHKTVTCSDAKFILALGINFPNVFLEVRGELIIAGTMISL